MSASELLAQAADKGPGETVATAAPRQPEPLFGGGKIQPHHWERLAIVYVRQSSPQQVLEHRESAALQYDLKRRAVALGWLAERVVVIDEDQGHSAKWIEGRLGFQRLLAEVGLDHRASAHFG